MRVGGGQAVHERIEHSMLDGSYDLLLRDELRLGFGKKTGLRMQAREVRNGTWRRTQNFGGLRRN
jgi:hypothetical protein